LNFKWISSLSKLGFKKIGSPQYCCVIDWFRQKSFPRKKESLTNKFCSIFSQLLQLLPKPEFQKAVKRTQAERHARGFTCWGQFVAMLFCQLGKANFLREITDGLRSCEGKLKHLGISAPHRSTLAYANEHRPWKLFQELFLLLLTQVQNEGLGKKSSGSRINLVALLRMNLFTHRDLWAWIHEPFDTPPADYDPEQLALNLGLI
jgi:hypothetical protein